MSRFFIGQIIDSLLRSKMKFNPVSFIRTIDKTISMTSESVHVSVTIWQSAVAHYDGNLMQRFRQQSPEIPVILGASHISFRISFYCVI